MDVVAQKRILQGIMKTMLGGFPQEDPKDSVYAEERSSSWSPVDCPLPGCYYCIEKIQDPTKRRGEIRKYLRKFAELLPKTQSDRGLLESWITALRTYCKMASSPQLPESKRPAIVRQLRELVNEGFVETLVALIGREQELISPFSMQILEDLLHLEFSDKVCQRIYALRDTLMPKLATRLLIGHACERNFITSFLAFFSMLYPKAFDSFAKVEGLLMGLVVTASYDMAQFKREFVPGGAGEYQWDVIKPMGCNHDLYAPRFVNMMRSTTIHAMSYVAPYLPRLVDTPEAQAFPTDELYAMLDRVFDLCMTTLASPHLDMLYPESVALESAVTVLVTLVDPKDTFDPTLSPSPPDKIAAHLLPKLAAPDAVDILIAAAKRFFKVAIVGFPERELNEAIATRRRHQAEDELDSNDFEIMSVANYDSLLRIAKLFQILCVSPLTGPLVAVNTNIRSLLDFLWTKSCAAVAHTLPPKSKNPKHQLVFEFLTRVTMRSWGVPNEDAIGEIISIHSPCLVESILVALAHMHHYAPDAVPLLDADKARVTLEQLRKPSLSARSVPYWTHMLRLTLPVRDQPEGRELAVQYLKKRVAELKKRGRQAEAEADIAQSKALGR